MQVVAIGQHRSWRDQDVIHIAFDGVITDSDLKQVRGVIEQISNETGHAFLIGDMTRSTGIDAAGRKYMVEWSKQRGYTEVLSVAYGINFATRTVLSLALNAMRLLGKRERGPVFVKDEAEALAWVAQERAHQYAEPRP